MQYFLYVILPFLFSAHDIHISVTEISVADENITVVSKIFLDDLQNAMGLVPGEELPEDYQGSDDLIQRFIDDNLEITLNNQSIVLELTSTEAALPAIWATFDAKYALPVDSTVSDGYHVIVKNTMMIDLFDDQKNITKLNVNGQSKEDVLDTRKTTEQFTF